MSGSLPHLETFILAAETCSFTGAARRLKLTQAAVSLRIAALERELGVPLFLRQSGRVVLTGAGRRLHEYATRIQALHDEARAEVSRQPVTVTGELCLVASTLPGEHLLPGYLARFQRSHPQVQVRVRICDSDEVFVDLEQGRSHLGLAGSRSPNPHLDQQAFAHDEMRLIVPAGHPLARRGRITLEQLRTVPLIVREPGSGSRRCLEQALGGVGVALGELVTLELGSSKAIKQAILQGLGGAILSGLVVAEAVEAGKLVALEVEGLELGRELYAVHDNRRALPIPARLFLDLLLPTTRSQVN